jgi:hypothetical protein
MKSHDHTFFGLQKLFLNWKYLSVNIVCSSKIIYNVVVFSTLLKFIIVFVMCRISVTLSHKDLLQPMLLIY